MTTTQKKTVATPSAEYHEAASRWVLPRALMGGTRAMREAGTRFLPQEPGESDPAYASRLARTTLFNGYRKTVKDMTGKVFANPVALGEDVPEQIVAFAENIDLAGRNLNTFAFDVFEDAISAPGATCILAEMPPAIDNATRADEIRLGSRPYLVHIKAEDVIGWKSALVNGQETLTQVRIRECVAEPDPDSPYEDKEVTQIRVLQPGKWQIWRPVPNKPEDFFLYAEGVTSLDRIPLAVCYLSRCEFMVGKPPLEDLADLNVAHWQSSSDQRNILHVARVPILFGAGFDDTTKLVVGAGTMARSSDADAKLAYVEHSGKAIGSGRDDLKDIEIQMQVMGLQLLMPEPNKTATGEVRDDVKENSQLAMMAKALEDAIEQALGFMAEYMGLGKDAGGSVTVNTDFGIAAGAFEDLATLLDSAKERLLTGETYLKELKRRGVLSEELDEVEEAKQAQALRDKDTLAESGPDPIPMDGFLRSDEPGGAGKPKAGKAQADPVAAIREEIRTAIAAIPVPVQPEPPVINVQVDAPVINVTPAAPPPVNVTVEPNPPAEVVVNVASPNITVESPQITVNAPPEGPSVTTVLEKDANGGITKFQKVPVTGDKA